MRNKKIRYYVSYGRNTSREACYTLSDVFAFVAHCLRNNTPITGIERA